MPCHTTLPLLKHSTHTLFPLLSHRPPTLPPPTTSSHTPPSLLHRPHTLLPLFLHRPQVLAAMGVDAEYGFGTLRLSWGRHSTEVNTAMTMMSAMQCCVWSVSLARSTSCFPQNFSPSLHISTHTPSFSVSVNPLLSVSFSFSLLLFLFFIHQGEIDRAADSIAAAISTLTESST
jgi:hypothetical protein